VFIRPSLFVPMIVASCVSDEDLCPCRRGWLEGALNRLHCAFLHRRPQGNIQGATLGKPQRRGRIFRGAGLFETFKSLCLGNDYMYLSGILGGDCFYL